jgi:hypothetical protein
MLLTLCETDYHFAKVEVLHLTYLGFATINMSPEQSNALSCEETMQIKPLRAPTHSPDQLWIRSLCDEHPPPGDGLV